MTFTLYTNQRERMDLISRQDAIDRGLLRYFTGKPCKNGHTAERHTLNSTCIECLRLAKAAERQRTRDRLQLARAA